MDSPRPEPGQDSPSPWKRVLLLALPPLIPLCLFLQTGLRGIDFGKHWDERFQVEAVQRAVRRDVLLPNRYNYPSVCFWLTYAALLPELELSPPATEDAAKARREALQAVAKTEAFKLRTRGLFLVLTSLSILWVYLLVLRWQGNWTGALLACTLVAGSWEIAYHARWIAPDDILMQFASLTALLFMTAWGSPSRGRWSLAAAVAAGVSTGTKYTAGLLIVPVLLAARMGRSAPEGKRPGLFGLLAAFAASYLVTTPGTLLSPHAFWKDLRYEMQHYSRGHAGFTVDAGFDHMGRMLRYLGESMFSPYPWLAIPIFILALLGCGVLVRGSRRTGLLLLSFPVLFLISLASSRVLFVRNVLPVVPFLAVAAAAGALFLAGRSPRLRHLPLALAGLVLVVNGQWLWRAAGTIEDRGTDRFVHELDGYLTAHPDETFFLSKAVRNALVKVAPGRRDNVVLRPDLPVDFAVFYPTDAGSLFHLPSNRPGSTVTWFGPREVNLEYYWSWMEPRIVVTRAGYARELGVLE
jgi:4-amino-4-deoxy-L-arabinose transferase-like glycosyltransferase